jgi:hypothetical protein
MRIAQRPCAAFACDSQGKVNLGPSMITTSHLRLPFCARDSVLEPCTEPGAVQSGRSGAIFAFAAPANGV